MKNTKSYFNRAWLVLAALLVSAFAAFSLAGCKTDDDDDEKEIHYSIYPVKLSADDPVSGVYSGNAGQFIFRPSLAYAIASSCAPLNSIEGKLKGKDYEVVTIDNYDNYPDIKKEDIYFNLKDSSEVYVVYNLLSDADPSDGISDDELDKHSGVILFQAKYSPYGSPVLGCWYGVKFQFLTEDGKIPTSTNENHIFSSTKIYIEGAVGDAYNNIAALDEAVEKFAFNNSDCFNEVSWTESSSGADKTGRSAFSSIVPTENIFTKVE